MERCPQTHEEFVQSMNEQIEKIRKLSEELKQATERSRTSSSRLSSFPEFLPTSGSTPS